MIAKAFQVLRVDQDGTESKSQLKTHRACLGERLLCVVYLQLMPHSFCLETSATVMEKQQRTLSPPNVQAM